MGLTKAEQKELAELESSKGKEQEDVQAGLTPEEEKELALLESQEPDVSSNNDLQSSESSKREEATALTQSFQELPGDREPIGAFDRETSIGGVKKQLKEKGLDPTPRRVLQGLVGRGLEDVFEVLQREESIATELIRTGTGLGDKSRIGLAAQGKVASELGDIVRQLGGGEPQAVVTGLAASQLLPSNIAGGRLIALAGKTKRLRNIRKAQQFIDSGDPQLIVKGKNMLNKLGNLKKAGAKLVDISEETLKKIEKAGGYRKILTKEYMSEQMPEVLQTIVETKVDDAVSALGAKFDEATKEIKKIPFGGNDRLKLKLRLNKARQKAGKDVLKEDSLVGLLFEKFDKTSFESVSDLLDFRRMLDDAIFSEKSGIQKANTKVVDAVRDELSKYLHEMSDGLSQADDLYYNLSKALKEKVGKNITSDTGAKFIERFRSLTNKQQEKLLMLEKQILKANPSERPFFHDLYNASLAGEFSYAPGQGAINRGKLIEKTILPLYRKGLKLSEVVGPQILDPIKKAVKKRLATTVRQSQTRRG